MIDAPKAILDYLLAQPGVTALTDTRIWAESSTPPPGYKPSEGAGLCMRARGGLPDASDGFLRVSWQCKCYGATAVEANALYRVVYSALHNAQAGTLRWGRCEVLGQPLLEPETNWPFILTVFELWVANE